MRRRMRILAGAVILAAPLAAVTAEAAPAQATAGPPACHRIAVGTLPRNTDMYTDDCLVSAGLGANQQPKATLIMQLDGNLVVYSEWGSALWASNTSISSPCPSYTAWQLDGNLVVHN